MNCNFCDREIGNFGCLKIHETSCKNNPNRIQRKRSPLAGAKKGSIPWNLGKRVGQSTYWKNKFPNISIFVENSSYPRHSIKKRILDENLIEYKCNICGLGPVWCDKHMPLILDHINGKNRDNRLENLRFVCSNCDSQLPTYKSKNRKIKMESKSGKRTETALKAD